MDSSQETLAGRGIEALMYGYVNQACGECGNFTLSQYRNGLKCETCGNERGVVHGTEGKRYYFIQGFFYHPFDSLDVSSHPEGAPVLIGAGPFMFAGVIKTKGGILVGGLRDEFGRSILSDVTVTETEVRFCKTYMDVRVRMYTSRYVFDKREENTWLGEFISDGDYAGRARCVITSVSDALIIEDLRVTFEKTQTAGKAV
ncbi:MAG TPA: hypothetical protein VMU27_02325 [Candidatus Paceibacterota bacterium]|nr:hypothetical protein [Candidatus Paceibacterota bacterium]